MFAIKHEKGIFDKKKTQKMKSEYDFVNQRKNKKCTTDIKTMSISIHTVYRNSCIYNLYSL